MVARPDWKNSREERFERWNHRFSLCITGQHHLFIFILSFVIFSLLLLRRGLEKKNNKRKATTTTGGVPFLFLPAAPIQQEKTDDTCVCVKILTKRKDIRRLEPRPYLVADKFPVFVLQLVKRFAFISQLTNKNKGKTKMMMMVFGRKKERERKSQHV